MRSSADRRSSDPVRLPAELGPALFVTWALFAIGFSSSFALGLILPEEILRASSAHLSLFFRQDVVVLAGLAIIIPAAYLLVSRTGFPTLQARIVSHRLFLPGLYFVFAVTCSLGVATFAHQYALSMDEFLARFQAEALRGGKFFAPVPERWAEWIGYLQPMFVRFDSVMGLWAPNYLPGNALLLAGFDVLGLMPWTHVVSGAVGLWLTARICKHVWPEVPWAPAAGAVLLATSAQFWITSMTSYAMTPHLLATMAWLLFFLRDDRLGHGLALAIAPLAMGIHQVYIHPLVALPFICWFVVHGRWKLFGLYSIWYAGWIAFWVAWGGILGSGEPGAEMSGLQLLWTTFQDLIAQRNLGDLLVWWISLLRFASWQNLAMIPLVVMGVLSVRSAPWPVRAGLVSVLLLLSFHVLLMPSQGFGWGYRYLHPVLGFLILASVHGAVRLAGSAHRGGRDRARRMVVTLALISLLALPLRAAQVEELVQPSSAAAAFIQRTSADVVLVDEETIWYGRDLVRNDPFLRRSPVVLAASGMSEREFSLLCREYRVEVVDFEALASLGIMANREGPSSTVRVRAARGGCSLPGVTLSTSER